MANPGIRVTGLAETLRDLKQYHNELLPEVTKMHREAAEEVLPEAFGRIPYRSGRLKGTLQVKSAENSARIVAGSATVPYAGPIHFGWRRRNITPNPFLYDAMDARRDNVLRLYEDRMQGLLNKIKGL